MTNGGVDRSVECTGNINAMIQAFECVHDVCTLFINVFFSEHFPSSLDSDRALTAMHFIQGWGVAVLVGVPHKDAEFKTHPMNFLNERTLKGTFFGNFKPRTDLPNVVELYMKKVNAESCFFSNLATWLVVVLVSLVLKLLALPNHIVANVTTLLGLHAGAGSGEVHHTQRPILGDQQGLRPDGEGGGHPLHHPHGALDSVAWFHPVRVGSINTAAPRVRLPLPGGKIHACVCIT